MAPKRPNTFVSGDFEPRRSARQKWSSVGPDMVPSGSIGQRRRTATQISAQESTLQDMHEGFDNIKSIHNLDHPQPQPSDFEALNALDDEVDQSGDATTESSAHCREQNTIESDPDEDVSSEVQAGEEEEKSELEDDQVIVQRADQNLQRIRIDFATLQSSLDSKIEKIAKLEKELDEKNQQLQIEREGNQRRAQTIQNTWNEEVTAMAEMWERDRVSRDQDMENLRKEFATEKQTIMQEFSQKNYNLQADFALEREKNEEAYRKLEETGAIAQVATRLAIAHARGNLVQAAVETTELLRMVAEQYSTSVQHG